MLMVHGALLNAAQYGSVAERLTGYRSVAVDLMGHGYTRIAGDQPLGMDHQAAVLADVTQKLFNEPVHLIGSDSGGGVAQILAAHRPDLIRSLTVTNCDVYDNNPPAAFAPFMRHLKDTGAYEYFSEVVEKPELATEPSCLGLALEDTRRLSEPLIRHFFAPLCATRENAANLFRYLAQNDGRHTIAVADLLGTIRKPTTIIWGDADPYFHLRWAYWLHRRVGNPHSLTVVRDGRLYTHLDRPALIGGIIHAALTDIDRRDAADPHAERSSDSRLARSRANVADDHGLALEFEERP